MLEFTLKDGSIVIIDADDFLEECYIAKESYSLENRQYLNKNWFYEKLKDNDDGICRLASLLEYKIINVTKETKDKIEAYKKEFEELVKPYGFDTHVYYLEEYLAMAVNERNLHWW